MEILQERLFPQISNFVYNLILDITSENKKANAETKWVCQQYLNKRFQSLDDGVFDNVNNLLHDYRKYKTKLKPILDYKTPEDLEDAIIAVNDSGYKTRTEFDTAARKGTKQIYKDNDYIVLKINNWIAAKKYGSNTKWCISTRYDDETFNHYYSKTDGEIYFIIDRINKEYKYACVGNVCYDEWDDILFIIDDDFNLVKQHSSIDELTTRISEDDNLINILPLGFPTFNKDKVIDIITKLTNDSQ